MINLKKQAWRTGALCLAGVVALSVTGVSVYAKTSEKKETEVKEQIRDAVDDIWKSEDTSAASFRSSRTRNSAPQISYAHDR